MTIWQGKPKVTSRGDIIYPLNVVLNSLPALTRRMRLSVTVWTPELDAFQDESMHKEEFKRFVNEQDPEELLEGSYNAWRCIGIIFFCSNLIIMNGTFLNQVFFELLQVIFQIKPKH